MKKTLLGAVMVLGLTLGSCGGSEADDAGQASPQTNATLAGLIGQADDLEMVASTLNETGLSEVFDGVAAYTILAPNDAAFATSGSNGAALSAADNRPLAVAVIRQHILPGYLTPNDIRSAIEAAEDGMVEMSTVGNSTVTFTLDDDTIIATGDDGSSGELGASASAASNGVVIPVSAVLVAIPQTEPAS